MILLKTRLFNHFKIHLFQRNLDEEITEKFVCLLDTCLDCICCILEVASVKAVEKIAEEILVYLKPLMVYSAEKVVSTVTQVIPNELFCKFIVSQKFIWFTHV